MPKMTITRKNCSIDAYRSYKIYLDNIYIGKIKNGEEQEFDILSGKHSIYFKMNALSSRKILFKVEKENRWFEVEAGEQELSNMFKIFFNPNDYILLKQRAV